MSRVLSMRLSAMAYVARNAGGAPVDVSDWVPALERAAELLRPPEPPAHEHEWDVVQSYADPVAIRCNCGEVRRVLPDDAAEGFS